MSRVVIEFHPEAATEAREAAGWYLDRSVQAGSNFKGELRHAELQVERYPKLWSPYLHGTRCLSFKRFPYGLVYLERGDAIIVLAVAHLHRKPGYLRERLDD